MGRTCDDQTRLAAAQTRVRSAVRELRRAVTSPTKVRGRLSACVANRKAARVIERSPLFDPAFYRSRYPDVAGAGVDPLMHFVWHGAAEGRDPSAAFDTAFYLAENPDVFASGVNPLAHYILHGAAEGRRCKSPPPAEDRADGTSCERCASEAARAPERTATEASPSPATAAPQAAAVQLAPTSLACINRSVQLLLRQEYQRARFEKRPLPPLVDTEFRCCSQNGEDGIIHYAFSLIGARTRRSVEIGAGDGVECNTANLIINHGWEGLLIDGDEASVDRGRKFYSSCQDTFSKPPHQVASWVTRDNINSLICESGFDGEIDLLSIDIDGMDYWIWKQLDVIAPRLVIVEFNPVWGPHLSLAVPYQADFHIDTSRIPYYCSASLQAFTKLARAKGYRLMGAQRLGFNAFFMADGEGEDEFPGITPAECFERTPVLKNWTPALIPTAKDRPDFGEAVEV